MTPEIANIILQFMRRTELRGFEVEAFLRAIAALQDVANGATKDAT